MTDPGKKEALAFILCLLLGFTLRFYTFDQKSLWMDEVHTFNDSRDDFKNQIKFYKENPTFLHPPLFFILTHQFYPFAKPERDLRVIPLIFGTLSVPLIYFLARSFSASIALPCAFSLIFMVYHISLSQDGRSYSLLMFLGMAGIYFFMKHLRTLKRRYLFGVALPFAILFYTSYSSIPFIALSQVLWFYQIREDHKRPDLFSFLILNGLILILCLPWIIFVASNFKGQPMMDPFHTEAPGSFLAILYGVIHDWLSHPPLMIVSVILLILFPVFSKNRRNAALLLSAFLLPIGGLYLFCKLANVTHFVSSRYFVNFLPFLFISIYLSLDSLEFRFEKIEKYVRLKMLFIILFVASNIAILPVYYTSEKEDFRGLVTYLKSQLREGDKIFVGTVGYIPGILHYLGAYPEGRHHIIPFRKLPGEQIEYRKSFIYRNKIFTIYHSEICCTQYMADRNRLWIIVGKGTAKSLKEESPCALKGYFDGSFLNLDRFPTDASKYLFLCDPSSPEEKGMDMPVN